MAHNLFKTTCTCTNSLNVITVTVILHWEQLINDINNYPITMTAKITKMLLKSL